jgi:hypothetical protein
MTAATILEDKRRRRGEATLRTITTMMVMMMMTMLKLSKMITMRMK